MAIDADERISQAQADSGERCEDRGKSDRAHQFERRRARPDGVQDRQDERERGNDDAENGCRTKKQERSHQTLQRRRMPQPGVKTLAGGRRDMEPVQLVAGLTAAALVLLWALPSLTAALAQVVASVRPLA